MQNNYFYLPEDVQQELTKEYVVSIRTEKTRCGYKTHTGVTIPYEWLETLHLTGVSPESRTVNLTLDLKTGSIIIKKA